MTSEPDDQIARMRSELEEGKWIQNASRHAQRRRSAWHILLAALIIPAIVLGKFLILHIAPARRAMEKEDRRYHGVGYASSQRALFKAGARTGPVAVAAVVARV